MNKIIGVPREHRPFEFRVGLIPSGVRMLTEQGHTVYVEAGAGLGSGFPDLAYEKAGAHIVYSAEEVFQQSDVVLKVLRITDRETDWLRENQVVMGFMMMATFPEARLAKLQSKGVALVSYELIQTSDGALPVLEPLSQIGGIMTAQIAAQFLQNKNGGTGILLGNIPGIPAADVAIVGAGVVGCSAAHAFIQMGAKVILLDNDLHQLQKAHQRFGDHIVTMVAYPFNLAKVCTFADVLVSAVQVSGEQAPMIITRDMVRSMHDNALIIDMSIDQGGSVETGKLTFHDNPIFMNEGVAHYCVLNVPGVVGRSATHAFLNAAWPYIQLIAEKGIMQASEEDVALQKGTILPTAVHMPH